MPLTHDRPINDKGVRALIMWAYLTRKRDLVFNRFCNEVESHVLNDFTAALGAVPQLEQVNFNEDAPEFKDLADFYIAWTNKIFKARMSIQRSAFDFDQTGQVKTLINSMGARLANYPDVLFFDRLAASTALEAPESGRNGNSTIYFFSTAHALRYGQTAMSNLLTGNTSYATVIATAPATTAVQLQTDFMVAVATMRSYKDDQGQPWFQDNMSKGKFIILCSPLLEEPFNVAFSAQMLNQTTNVFQNRVEVLSSNYLSTASGTGADWYLCYQPNDNMKPFTYSKFRRIQPNEIEDFRVPDNAGFGYEDLMDWASIQIETNLGLRGTNTDSDIIQNDRYLIQARMLGEIFPTVWQNIVKVDNS